MTNCARIIEYCVSSIEMIPKWLSEGFEPYGSPFLWRETVSCGDTKIYQALIKRETELNDSMPLKIKHPRYGLSVIEQRCVEGLLSDLRYTDIAKAVHRSPRTVRNIIGRLRQTWDCQTNVGLILAIQNRSINVTYDQ